MFAVPLISHVSPPDNIKIYKIDANPSISCRLLPTEMKCVLRAMLLYVAKSAK